MKLTTCLVIVAAASQVSLAQTVAGQKIGLVRYVQASHAGIARDLLAAAEKMPETDYSFTPSQMNGSRTYGAVIAHVADGMFDVCARARGVPNPTPDVEKTFTAKPDLVRVLAGAIAFCNEAFSALTDRSATEYVPQGPVEVPRIAALMGLLAHNAEMYGISSVYLRARNIVPPASESR